MFKRRQTKKKQKQNNKYKLNCGPTKKLTYSTYNDM